LPEIRWRRNSRKRSFRQARQRDRHIAAEAGPAQHQRPADPQSDSIRALVFDHHRAVAALRDLIAEFPSRNLDFAFCVAGAVFDRHDAGAAIMADRNKVAVELSVDLFHSPAGPSHNGDTGCKNSVTCISQREVELY
jgi:hypothetical protein